MTLREQLRQSALIFAVLLVLGPAFYLLAEWWAI